MYKAYKNKIFLCTVLVSGVIFVVIVTLYFKRSNSTETSNFSVKQEVIQNFTEIENKSLTDTRLGDQLFSEGIKDLYEKYPWYINIPIDTNDFTIIFDFDRDEFRVRLKIQRDAPLDVKNILTQKAEGEISKLNAHTSKYYIMYQE